MNQMLKYYVIKILGLNCKEREVDKSVLLSLGQTVKEVYFNVFPKLLPLVIWVYSVSVSLSLCVLCLCDGKIYIYIYVYIYNQ